MWVWFIQCAVHEWMKWKPKMLKFLSWRHFGRMKQNEFYSFIRRRALSNRRHIFIAINAWTIFSVVTRDVYAVPANCHLPFCLRKFNVFYECSDWRFWSKCKILRYISLLFSFQIEINYCISEAKHHLRPIDTHTHTSNHSCGAMWFGGKIIDKRVDGQRTWIECK